MQTIFSPNVFLLEVSAIEHLLDASFGRVNLVLSFVKIVGDRRAFYRLSNGLDVHNDILARHYKNEAERAKLHVLPHIPLMTTHCG